MTTLKHKHFFVEMMEMMTTLDSNLGGFTFELDSNFIKNAVKSVQFSDDHYTRTVIFLNDSIEVLLVAWMPGQSSVIHNHEGNSCLWTVIHGSLSERKFEWENKTKSLNFIDSTEVLKDERSFDDDASFFHQVQNTSNNRAVSLHIYKKPLKTCTIFDVGTSKLSKMAISYHFEQFDFFDLD